MSVVTPANVTIASTEKRTLQLIIDTPKGRPYSCRLFREARNMDAQGAQVGETIPAPEIPLAFNDIAPERVTALIGGQPVTMTVGELCGFIAAYCDQKATALGL